VSARLRAGAPARVATYHYYYRGLSFYLDAPVVLLGERNELKLEAFARRPELFAPNLLFPYPGGVVWGEDCWTRAFLARGPLLVVVPDGQRRPQLFLDACRRAGVRAKFLERVEDDLIFEAGP
jgi:hypothetical protein